MSESSNPPQLLISELKHSGREVVSGVSMEAKGGEIVDCWDPTELGNHEFSMIASLLARLPPVSRRG